MDIQFFVQNVKRLLDERGISYSRAGRESGAGIEFIRNMERKGSWPSTEKVLQIADYLGVSVGELLGEEKELTPVSEGELNETAQRFMPLVDKLTPEQQQLLLAQLQAWTGQNGWPSPAAPSPDGGTTHGSDP